MTRSILSLDPALRDVWARTYAAIVGGYQPPNAAESIAEVSSWAENYAWEAVRRANGGEMPVGELDTDGMVETLAPIVAEAEYSAVTPEALARVRRAFIDAKSSEVSLRVHGTIYVALASWKAAQAAPVLKAVEEFQAINARGGMPCAHTIGDLIGGTGAVTKCGACLAERNAAIAEAAKPEPCSRCKTKPSAFGDLCVDCEIYDHGDPGEIARLEAKKARPS